MSDTWNGLPERPESNGKHWLKHMHADEPEIYSWNAKRQAWLVNDMYFADATFTKDFRYMEPVAPCGTLAVLRLPSFDLIVEVGLGYADSGVIFCPRAAVAFAAILREIEK